MADERLDLGALRRLAELAAKNLGGRITIRAKTLLLLLDAAERKKLPPPANEPEATGGEMRDAKDVAEDLLDASLQCETDLGVPTREEEIGYLLPIVQKRDAELVAAPSSGATMPDLPAFCRMHQAAEVVGVEPHVLRYWETEFSYWLRVERSTRGQRVYTRRQVELLIEIRRLLHTELYTIKGTKRQLRMKGTRLAAGAQVRENKANEGPERRAQMRSSRRGDCAPIGVR